MTKGDSKKQKFYGGAADYASPLERRTLGPADRLRILLTLSDLKCARVTSQACTLHSENHAIPFQPSSFVLQRLTGISARRPPPFSEDALEQVKGCKGAKHKSFSSR